MAPSIIHTHIRKNKSKKPQSNSPSPFQYALVLWHGRLYLFNWELRLWWDCPVSILFHFVNLTSGRTAPMGPTELDMKIDRTHLSREKKSERETAVVSRGRRARMEKLIFCGHPVPSALQIGENPDEYDGEARERVYVICAFGTLCFFLSFLPSIFFPLWSP